MKNLKNKIIYCLETYPETRNSDVQLTFRVIYEIMPQEMIKQNEKWFISTKALKFVREDHIKRIRAKLNEKNLYLPTNLEVRKQRKINEERWRNHLGFSPELRTC